MARFKGTPKNMVIPKRKASAEELAKKQQQAHQAQNKGPTKKTLQNRAASKHKARRNSDDSS